MTDTKSILNLVVADQSSKLSDFAIGHQQIIFLEDRRVLALDYNGKRTFYNQIEILKTDDERKELNSPTQGQFYFIIGTAMLWFYDSEWIRITTPPKEIVCIGTELPTLGSENTLYVNKLSGSESISVWDTETQSYKFIAGKTKAISSSKIDELF
jgi:hypothetical protein